MRQLFILEGNEFIVNVYEDYLGIEQKPLFGVLRNSSDCERFIYYRDIASLQFKEAGTLNSGFIEFFMASPHAGAMFPNKPDNKFMYGGSFRKRDDNFRPAVDYILMRVRECKVHMPPPPPQHGHMHTPPPPPPHHGHMHNPPPPPPQHGHMHTPPPPPPQHGHMHTPPPPPQHGHIHNPPPPQPQHGRPMTPPPPPQQPGRPMQSPPQQPGRPAGAFCPKCGKPVSGNFCQSCGARIN